MISQLPASLFLRSCCSFMTVYLLPENRLDFLKLAYNRRQAFLVHFESKFQVCPVPSGYWIRAFSCMCPPAAWVKGMLHVPPPPSFEFLPIIIKDKDGHRELN